MKFLVECFENVDAFSQRSPFIWTDAEQFLPFAGAFRRVQTLVIDEATPVGAAHGAFEIGNAPWNPTDSEGTAWDHSRVRSMSSGDIVVVHTPDGALVYGCMSFDWCVLPPTILPDYPMVTSK